MLIFIVLFWTYYNCSFYPSIWLGNTWPGVGLSHKIQWWSAGLYNSCILLLSSCFITWADLTLKLRTNIIESVTALVSAIFISIHFLMCQYIEFSRLPFTFRDTMYGTLFYSITGLHLCHVLIGSLLLFITLFLLLNIQDPILKKYSKIIEKPPLDFI